MSILYILMKNRQEKINSKSLRIGIYIIQMQDYQKQGADFKKLYDSSFQKFFLLQLASEDDLILINSQQIKFCPNTIMSTHIQIFSNNTLKCQENIPTKNLNIQEETILLKSKIDKNQSRSIRSNKITRFGPWRKAEIKKYCIFFTGIQKNIKISGFTVSQMFSHMSKFINTRNVAQCKLQHRKLLSQFGSIQGILKQYIAKQKFFKNKKVSKTIFQVNEKLQQNISNSFCSQQQIRQSFSSLVLTKKQPYRQVQFLGNDSHQKDDLLFLTDDQYQTYPAEQKRKPSINFLRLLNNEHLPRVYFGASNPYLRKDEENPFMRLIEKPIFMESFEAFREVHQNIFDRDYRIDNINEDIWRHDYKG